MKVGSFLFLTFFKDNYDLIGLLWKNHGMIISHCPHFSIATQSTEDQGERVSHKYYANVIVDEMKGEVTERVVMGLGYDGEASRIAEDD